jgi:malate/lactate dehydrogenase
MIRFSGAIIWTYDLARLRYFYENTLGLKPHSVREHFIAYKWGDLKFSIGSHSEITGNSIEPL